MLRNPLNKVFSTASNFAKNDLSILELAIHLSNCSAGFIALKRHGAADMLAHKGLGPTGISQEDLSTLFSDLGKEQVFLADTGLQSHFREVKFFKNTPQINFYAGTPLVDNNGETIGLLAVLNPHPLKLASEKQLLLQSLANLAYQSVQTQQANATTSNLAHLLDHQSVGVLITNQDGQVIFSNKQIFDLLNISYNDADSPTQYWRDILLSKGSSLVDVEDFERFVNAVMNSPNETFIREFTTVDDNILEFEFSPVLSNERFDGFVIRIRDLSEKRKTDSLVEYQRLQLVDSQRLSSLGEMASGVAHEINNPMAIIYGRAIHLVELAKKGDVPREQVSNYSQHIIDVTQRVIAIVAGLRSFSRNGEKDPLRSELVSNIVESTLAFCTQRLKLANIDLQISLGSEPVAVQCRPVQVSQILLNLVNNSYDAVATVTKKWIRIEVVPLFDEVLIAVTDSGPGIPFDIQKKIFDPFYTTKVAEKGTGLGLSISQNLARSQGGDLQLDPTATHTRFVLRMPTGKT